MYDADDEMNRLYEFMREEAEARIMREEAEARKEDSSDSDW